MNQRSQISNHMISITCLTTPVITVAYTKRVVLLFALLATNGIAMEKVNWPWEHTSSYTLSRPNTRSFSCTQRGTSVTQRSSAISAKRAMCFF